VQRFWRRTLNAVDQADFAYEALSGMAAAARVPRLAVPFGYYACSNPPEV